MFERTQQHGLALNWRGPLLVAAIFAAGFAVLLLMAHQNESQSSDMGSSLREDPYGTSLLFNAYGRAGYRVIRSQDSDSLADQDAARTTAFLIGGSSFYGLGVEAGPARLQTKFSRRIENFLAHGGRVVLVAPMVKLQSESQGWQVERKWDEKERQSGATWLSPFQAALPPASEKMFLNSSAPWLETDAAWTPLYLWPADANPKPAVPGHVYMAMRNAGKGQLIAASQSAFLLNETIKVRPNPVLLNYLAGGRSTIWVDETLHGLYQDQGVLWLLQRYRLQVALLLFWTALLTLLWSMSGDLVRRPAPDRKPVMRRNEGVGTAAQRLLQRSIPVNQVVHECWEQYRLRAPQDAAAILADAGDSSRLHAALEKPALEGYRLLSQLIAARRAAARGLAGLRQAGPAQSVPLARTGSEEKTK